MKIASSIGLRRFQAALSTSAGSTTGPDLGEWDAYYTVREALWWIVHERTRPWMTEYLLTAKGSTSELFVSFWHSVYEREARVAILNDATGQKMNAFAWVDQGCPYSRP